MPKVFISHSSDDRDLVEREIIAPLNQSGIATWYALDAVRAGDDWRADIRRGLDACDWFLVALSPNSVTSEWVKVEVMLALKHKRERVVPVLLRDCDVAECDPRLEFIQYVDFRESLDDGRRRLLARFIAPKGSSPPDDPAAKLRSLQEHPDASQIPFVCRSLAHADEEVRRCAQRAMHAIGWGSTVAAIQDYARDGTDDPIRDILTGLGAIEAHPDVINALARLTAILTGDLRNQAILLAGRKRLSLQRTKLAALFQERDSSHEILKLLGQGVFTATYLARYREGDLEEVVRVLLPEFALQDSVRTQFMDLSKRAMRYKHENLVLTREVGQFADHNLYYTVRENVRGVTLQNALDNRKVFEPVQIVEIVWQVARALTPIHKAGEVHGGIKPSNIFITDDYQVQLGDLSLPVSAAPPNLKRLSYDYRYAPPEAFQGGESAEPASDFYSLGCVAYQLLTGEPPFVSDNPFTLATLHCQGTIKPLARYGNRLGPTGDKLILQLLARTPTDRPRHLDEVLDILASVRRGLHTSAERTSVTILGSQARADFEPEYSLVSLGQLVGGGESQAAPRAHPSGDSAPAERSQAVMHSEARSLAAEGGATSASRLSPSPEVETFGFGTIHPRDFRLVAKLGEGGMGTVFKAHQISMDREVALKILTPRLSDNKEFVERFYREARMSVRLDHPNIVRGVAVGEDHGVHYFAMEFVEGGTLEQWLQRLGRLSVGDAVKITLDVARALEHAHSRPKPVYHRDIKPANIMIATGGEVKLADLGLAKAAEDDNLTQIGEMAGTPAYMPPEQARDAKIVDGRSDIYALGITAYYLLTGRKPFTGRSPLAIVEAKEAGKYEPASRINPEVPEALDHIIDRMIAPEPRRRYQSAAELIAALDTRGWATPL